MADAKKVRAFIDANVLFAGIAFPRWPYEVLRHAAAGDFQLVLSPLVIKQAQRNLQIRLGMLLLEAMCSMTFLKAETYCFSLVL